VSEPSPSPEEAWRTRPDPMRWALVVVDLLLGIGLFVGSLLFLLPLSPHLEISSDSMDPFSHAWEIWTGRAHPLSSHNLLYAYGRAWTSLPLLLGAEGLQGIARRMAIASSTMAPLVYLAARILTGGTSPGPGGKPVRRVGIVLGPLLGALLLVRYQGFLWSQVAGSHVYLSAEWAALALIPAALLLRTARLGGGDAGPSRPFSRSVLAAIGLAVCVAMSALNHPYGAAQAGLLLPLGALLVSRLGRQGWLLLGVMVGVGALLGAPHAVHLLAARSGMGESLVEYSRSDAEFGYLTWTESFHRLTMARTESGQGWLLFQAPAAALIAGLAALKWRPRLGGATAMVGGLALTATITQLLLTRVSQHIQPYHWHPLLPLAALSAAMAISALLDLAFRRSQSERIRDAERGRGFPAVVGRRAPLALVAVLLAGYVGNTSRQSLMEDRGYLDSLWEISMPRQAVHHERVARILLSAHDGPRTPVLGGLDLPDFAVTLDAIALTFELISRGQNIEDVARNPAEDEVMFLHIGLGRSSPEELLNDLGEGITLVQGDSNFLMLRGRTRDFRAWTRRFCDGRPGPRRLRAEERDPYWVRGSLETKHLVVGGEFYPAPYPWSHPCMEPFAWPDISPAEYPLMPMGTEPGELSAVDQYMYTELGPFFSGRTETTRRDWAQCVADGACEVIALDPEPLAPRDPWLPQVGVTAEQALTYCRWLADDVEWDGRRWTGDLPNSVEFEILGSWRRAVSEARTRWPWGDEPSDALANGAGSDGFPGLAPVGSFVAGHSPMAHEDLAGNAAEWVHRATRPTRQDEYPWGRPLPGFLLAGGSFRSDVPSMRNGVFEVPAPDRALDDVGFRCVIRGVSEDGQ